MLAFKMEPRNQGSLEKLEKGRKGIRPYSLQKECSPAAP